MSLWKIAWRSIQQRALASSLTAVSMALGVTLVISVLVIHGVIDASFRENAQGYDMIVGGKGGSLQLVLNTVYYLSRPTQNLPYRFYKEFTEGGKFAEGVQWAIPVCMGDNYQGFRVVGTTPQLFDAITYQGQKVHFAEGRPLQPRALFRGGRWRQVARKTGLKVGQPFRPTHGIDVSAEQGHHHHEAFTVVGVLGPTGTPNDRALFINIEGSSTSKPPQGCGLRGRSHPQRPDGQGGLAAGRRDRGIRGNPLATPQDLQALVERTDAGKPQVFAVVRDGKRTALIVTASESASGKAESKPQGNTGDSTLVLERLGLKVQSLVQALGEHQATEHHAEEHQAAGANGRGDIVLAPAATPASRAQAEEQHAGEHHHGIDPDEPVPDELKEVTAILVRTNMEHPGWAIAAAEDDQQGAARRPGGVARPGDHRAVQRHRGQPAEAVAAVCGLGADRGRDRDPGEHL